ncbi:MAG: thiamine phosphate synthase [Anaerovoracaceae bacterium]|jgi:thiamine-phosphate diphosphorylase
MYKTDGKKENGRGGQSDVLRFSVVVTNRSLVDGSFTEQIRRALALRPESLILREKDLADPEYLALAREISALCRDAGCGFFFHSRRELAEAAGFDQIHVPFAAFREDPEAYRSFRRVSVSVHSVEEAVMAGTLGADRVVLGNVFETDCKKGKPGLGLDVLEEACRRSSIPVYAIGGIDPSNLPDVLSRGAAGGCMMSWFMKTGA